MRQHSIAFRLAAATALVGILSGAAAPAYAQSYAPAPGPTLGVPQVPPVQAGDPPARVGRVARTSGTVSFHTADADHWEAAALNEPVTSGNAFWTQPGASADLDIGTGRVALDQASEFSIDQLDDANFVATASQGRAYLRLRDVRPGDSNTIRTPRGSVVIAAPGSYEIIVGDTQTPTTVTVREGAATITGPGVSLSVGPHQSAEISGADNAFSGVVVEEVGDEFLAAQLNRDHPPMPVANMPPPPPMVQEMTGYDAVISTGTWDDTPDYGRVWYPPVEAGWAPYRDGHWAFVAPWGWTWVDDAPWGFAPFHYGRWVEWHDRWAWVPVGRGEYGGGRPVYAPALVSFVGAAAGVAVGIGIAAAVGWIPLGPHEAYRPPYAVSNSYMQRVNVTHVTNITNINAAPSSYVNAHAATMAPAGAMQSSQSLHGVAKPVPQSQLSAFQPTARPSVAPVAGAVHPTPGPSFHPHAGAVSAAPTLPHPGGFNAAPSHPSAPNGLPPMTVHGAPPAPSQPGHVAAPVGGNAVGGGAAVPQHQALPPHQGAPQLQPQPSPQSRPNVALPDHTAPAVGAPVVHPSAPVAIPQAQPHPSAPMQAPQAQPRPAASVQVPQAQPHPSAPMQAPQPQPRPAAPMQAPHPQPQPQPRAEPAPQQHHACPPGQPHC